MELNLIQPRNITITLLDVLGKQVLSQEFNDLALENKERIALDKIDSGVYLVMKLF